MTYVIQGGKESLISKCDNLALGIINIDLEGQGPINSPNQDISFNTHNEISRMEMLHKPEKPTHKKENE